MIVQNILFPKENICDEMELYFHDSLGKISLDTYFNSFACGKWKRYTAIDKIRLELEYSGKLISFRTYHLSEDGTISEWKNGSTIPDNGILYGIVEGDDSLRITGGGWASDRKPIHDVRIAIGICTYKREKYVERNMISLCSEILNNPMSPLYDKLEVYIADNGHTLSKSQVGDGDEAKVHLFQNPNYGGAAGFTRTMIEAVLKDRRYTHMLLMDDDAVFDPQVIVRTFNLLSYLKDEYRLSMIGGAMLSQEEPWKQLENGSSLKKAFGKSLDLRQTKAVLDNNIFYDVDYNAWFYCCIPASLITSDNLPLPLFIHYDDIEYSLRNKNREIILINGMNVWHPDPIRKPRETTVYYDVRNRLITLNTLSSHVDQKIVPKELLHYILYTALHYEYDKAEMMLRGFEDYLAGPEKFEEIDPEELNNTVRVKRNYIDIYDAPKAEKVDQDTGITKECIEEIRYLFLPAKDNLIAAEQGTRWNPKSAKKVLLCIKCTGKGVELIRSRKRFLSILHKIYKLSKECKHNYTSVNTRWYEAKKRFVTLEFWKKYLHLDI